MLLGTYSEVFFDGSNFVHPTWKPIKKYYEWTQHPNYYDAQQAQASLEKNFPTNIYIRRREKPMMAALPVQQMTQQESQD